jgi:ankyrin repeat protein
MVSWCLRHSEDINIDNTRLECACCLAADNNYLDTIRVVQKYLTKDNIDSIFRHCVLKYNYAIIKFLLKQRADPNMSLMHHKPPLLSAFRSGKSDIIKLLVSYGADIHYDNGWYLMIAIKYDNILLVKYVLDHNVSPNVFNGAPLEDAIWKDDDLTIAKLLITFGATITINNLRYAIKNVGTNVVEMLLRSHKFEYSEIQDLIDTTNETRPNCAYIIPVLERYLTTL